MNFNSLITKITFIFIVSVILFIMVFTSYYYYEKNELYKQIKTNYIKITGYIKVNRLLPIEIKKYMEKLNFKVVENPFDVIKVAKEVASGPGFDVLESGNTFYINIHGPDFRILIKDLDTHILKYSGFFILGFIFLIYIFSFLWIIKSLKPLKTLKRQINEFSNGNLNITCRSEKKDEIAEVANEFDSAVKKITLLLNSRQLFLRTIMHELKTPIAKGRIVSELIDNEKQKGRMITIFDKLNVQINDFARIEEIVSHNYSINKYPTALNKIIKKAVDMMMLDNPDNKILLNNISNKVLKVDLDLFSLAIKNLLDNGIKYSIDKKVIIEDEEEFLCIKSKGDKLEKPLEEYFKAYHNETKSKNHGMGLGLYLVNEILKMHKLNLTYTYKNNHNIFKIFL